jgi:hypothetical protein
MASVSTFALRLPPSLMEDVKALAAQNAVSVRPFVFQATVEMGRDVNARGSLAKRAGRAMPDDLSRILAKAGTSTPIEGDEVPEAWLTVPSGVQAGG